MDIDLLVHNVTNSYLQMSDSSLGIASIATLFARSKQLTAHDRMTDYLLMNEDMYSRLSNLREVREQCRYPYQMLQEEKEEKEEDIRWKGTLLGMKIYTHEKIPRDMMFVAMVEEKLCIVAVGMGMY